MSVPTIVSSVCMVVAPTAASCVDCAGGSVSVGDCATTTRSDTRAAGAGAVAVGVVGVVGVVGAVGAVGAVGDVGGCGCWSCFRVGWHPQAPGETGGPRTEPDRKARRPGR